MGGFTFALDIDGPPPSGFRQLAEPGAEVIPFRSRIGPPLLFRDFQMGDHIKIAPQILRRIAHRSHVVQVGEGFHIRVIGLADQFAEVMDVVQVIAFFPAQLFHHDGYPVVPRHRSEAFQKRHHLTVSLFFAPAVREAAGTRTAEDDKFPARPGEAPANDLRPGHGRVVQRSRSDDRVFAFLEESITRQHPCPGLPGFGQIRFENLLGLVGTDEVRRAHGDEVAPRLFHALHGIRLRGATERGKDPRFGSRVGLQEGDGETKQRKGEECSAGHADRERASVNLSFAAGEKAPLCPGTGGG